MENSHTPPKMSLEILGGSTKTKKSNEKYEVELEFQWAGEVGSLGKNPFWGGGMDILRNYTIIKKPSIINLLHFVL